MEYDVAVDVWEEASDDEDIEEDEEEKEEDDDGPFVVAELPVNCNEVLMTELAVLLELAMLLELETDEDVIRVFDVGAVALEAVVVVEPAMELDSVAEAELVEAEELNIEVVEVGDAGPDVVALPVLAEEVEDETDSGDDNDVAVLDVGTLVPVTVPELSCRDELETDDDTLGVSEDGIVLEALEPIESMIELEVVIESDEDTSEPVEVGDDAEAEADVVVVIGFTGEVDAEAKLDDAVLDKIEMLAVMVLELVDGVSGVLELKLEVDDEAVDPGDDVKVGLLLELAALVLLLYDKDDCVSLRARLLSTMLLDVELAVREMLAELVETELSVREGLVGDVLEVFSLDTVSVVLMKKLMLLAEGPGSELLTIEFVVKLDIVDVVPELTELVEVFSGLDVSETALLIEVDSELCCSVEDIVDETKLPDELPPVEMAELDSDAVAVAESTSEVLDIRLEEDKKVSMSELGIEADEKNEFAVLVDVTSTTDDVDANDSDVGDGDDVTISEEDELEDILSNADDEADEFVADVDMEEVVHGLVSGSCEDDADEIDGSKLVVSDVEIVDVEVISIEELDIIDVISSDEVLEISVEVPMSVEVKLSELCTVETEENDGSRLEAPGVEAVEVGLASTEELVVVAVSPSEETPELSFSVPVSLKALPELLDNEIVDSVAVGYVDVESVDVIVLPEVTLVLLELSARDTLEISLD